MSEVCYYKSHMLILLFYGADYINDTILCSECGEPMQFKAWRGLNMQLICPGCGQVTMEKNPYWGLEADLDRY